jgi:hypothetical protein
VGFGSFEQSVARVGSGVSFPTNGVADELPPLSPLLQAVIARASTAGAARRNNRETGLIGWFHYDLTIHVVSRIDVQVLRLTLPLLEKLASETNQRAPAFVSSSAVWDTSYD